MDHMHEIIMNTDKCTVSLHKHGFAFYLELLSCAHISTQFKLQSLNVVYKTLSFGLSSPLKLIF